MEISDNLTSNITATTINSAIKGQNYLLSSEDFSDSTTWKTSNLTVTTDSIADPIYETLTADTLASANNVVGVVYQDKIRATSTGNSNIIFSVYLKANTTTSCYVTSEYISDTSGTYTRLTLQVNLVTGVITSTTTQDCVTGTCTAISNGSRTSSIENIGNGWYRVSLFNIPTDYAGAVIYIRHAIFPDISGTNKSLYAWGAQLEQATTTRLPYVYTVTTTSTITTTSIYTSAIANKGIGYITEVFTSSGTWTKPTGAKFVKVIVHGAGGGGSLGTYYCYNSALDSTCNSGYGGGSGAPGGRIENVFTASALSATVPITIGSGGTGAASSSIPNSGNNGSFSSFGFYLKAFGGTKGIHGTSGVGGALPSNGTTKNNIFENAYGAGQGGAGGNSLTTAGSAYIEGNSGFPGSYIRLGENTLVGNNGTTSSINASSGTSRSGTGFGGDGGGGGSASTYNSFFSGNSGAGGNGGIPGGGGGGGGGRYKSDSSSGKGGNGARGEVIVITYF